MKLGIWYLYIHSEIYRIRGKRMLESDLRSTLFLWRVPRKVIPLIIKELFMSGLIKKINRVEVELAEPMFDKEDCNFYYEKLGMYQNGK